MERFPLSKSSRKQAELWNCSLVHILSSWAFSFFNLYFCFMLIGITCWDHILDSLIFCLFVWFTPTCLKRSFFLPHCSHSAMLQKKKKRKQLKKKKKKRSLKWQIPNGQKSLENKDGQCWTGSLQEPTTSPLPQWQQHQQPRWWCALCL